MLSLLTFTPSARPVNISGKAVSALQVPWVNPAVSCHADATDQL